MQVRGIAEQLDIDYEDIERKANRVENIAEGKDIDLDEAAILPYFDMNGPVVDKESVDYEVHSGVDEAMKNLAEISEHRLSMLSGWDVSTLQFVAEERLGLEMDHVGELGSQAVIDNGELTTVDVDYDEIVELRRDILLEAAADELTINEQGNVSPVTGCTYVEGHRKGMFDNHPIAGESAEFSAEELYDELRQRGAGEGDVALGDENVITQLPERLEQDSGEYLAVDLEEDEAVEALSSALTREYPLMGVKLEYVGGQEIRLTGNTEESVEMSDDNLLSYFHRFMDARVDGTVFETEHNPDMCSDYQRKDIDVSKEYGANFRADQLLEEDQEAVLMNVGDKPGDVLEGENAIFFDQRGYPSEKYVDEEDIPAVTVESAADYALVTAELIERHS